MPRVVKLGGRIFLASLSPIVSFGSRFARNIILSRLLSPDEFGTAVAIGVMLMLGELATDVALDRFVLINGSREALSTSHLLSVVRATFIATVLIIAAPLVAGWFGVPDSSDGFAVAGGISVLNGFVHLGVKQVQRNYQYGAETISRLVASVSATLVLFPAVAFLHNHNAIIVSFALEALTYVVLSQLLARSTYRWSLDVHVTRLALGFGLPLMLNGIGLAIIYQFDRFIVGYWFGVAELAKYTVITSLAVVPTNLILSTCGTLGMSYLLSGNPTSAVRSERYDLLIGLFSIVATGYVVIVAVTLDILTPWVFGRSFTVSPLEHLLFCIIACLRLQRGGAPTTLLLVAGRTRRLAYLTLSAGSGYFVAWPLITITPRLESLLIGVAVGELISLLLFLGLSGAFVTSTSKMVADVARVLAAPAAIVLFLWLSGPESMQARACVLIGGLVVAALQVLTEIYRNRHVIFDLVKINYRVKRHEA